MSIASEILALKERVSALPPQLTWRESLLAQLNYCAEVVEGVKSPDQLEKLTMGLIAVRELEGEAWATNLSSVQHHMQQSYLSYAAKVRLGIHRRA